MTATATRLAPVQQTATPKHSPTGLVERFDTPRTNHPQALLTDDESLPLPAISVADSIRTFRVVVPLDGIDARQVFVFATPFSIVVEIRIKRVLEHPGPINSEIQRYRITRELRCREGIAKGSTAVRLLGSNLEITGIKASSPDDEDWSEFIQVDTRCSLGACQSL